ncbi:MAG: DUF1566 domain-containing protein [Spirochaetes bacterium]|uniref:DUF1566 domain-containing protein n=1 Tax=Candidatus Gallitreponema excrementavium TaxID=2840840 RepID=A0A9D9HMN9_9SPIR|nr:DUF1566 domain-containing protein [Candidatus Gallitreponema excrementavium]
MKKIILVLIVLFFTALVFGQIEPKSMAVMTFDVKGNAVSSEEAEAITELYITELISTGRISVVDRTNFNKLLQEMQFLAGDWADSEKIVKLGTAAGAEVICRGQILKLGSKMYLSATVIDVKTAKVMASANAQFDSIDDVFGVLTTFASDIAEGVCPMPCPFKIGDTGPGGGIVFYVKGIKAWECSEILGSSNWEGAKSLCSEYRGGGYSDWYLPSKDELNLVYINLKSTGKISDDEDDDYWSSSELSKSDAWRQSLGSGYQFFSNKDNMHSVRAVRAFNY